MNVGIYQADDSTGFRAHAQRGTGRYTRELLNFFGNHQSEIAVSAFDQSYLRGSGLVNRCVDFLPAGKATVKQQILAPLQLAGRGTESFDYLHFPAHIDAPSWCTKPYIVTVLDLIPVVLADLYRADKPSWRFRLARWLELQAIRSASLILAISECTAKDVHELLGVSYENIVVTPLGVDQKFFAQQRFSEQELRSKWKIPERSPVVLYLGGIDQRKNMKGLIGSFTTLVEMCRERSLPDPVLFMAGGIERDAEFPKLKSLISQHQVESLVMQPGYVSDEELMELFALSSVFFFPSLYEGFGLPPLEAMAAGVPVVSSNRSSLPEVIGDAAITVDPEDEHACAAALLGIFETPQLRQDLSAMGRKQAQLFTWEKTGQKTLEAYRRLEQLRHAA